MAIQIAVPQHSGSVKVRTALAPLEYSFSYLTFALKGPTNHNEFYPPLYKRHTDFHRSNGNSGWGLIEQRS